MSISHQIPEIPLARLEPSPFNPRETFIGLQEMYPLCVRALTTLMGNPRAPEARVRINTAHADQVVLTPDKEAELRRLNAVDFGLFNAMMERWKPIRDDLRAYLAQQKPAKAA